MLKRLICCSLKPASAGVGLEGDWSLVTSFGAEGLG